MTENGIVETTLQKPFINYGHPYIKNKVKIQAKQLKQNDFTFKDRFH